MTFEEIKQEILDSKLPVLVDIWAEWCGPCKMLTPIVDATAITHAGILNVLKVDADTVPDFLEAYGVRGIPTILIFKDGDVVARKTGAMAKATMDAFIASAI